MERPIHDILGEKREGISIIIHSDVDTLLRSANALLQSVAVFPDMTEKRYLNRLLSEVNHDIQSGIYDVALQMLGRVIAMSGFDSVNTNVISGVSFNLLADITDNTLNLTLVVPDIKEVQSFDIVGNDLEVTYNDNSVVNLGRVVGIDGINGANGQTPTPILQDNGGEILLSFDVDGDGIGDTTPVNIRGVDGSNGVDGVNGVDGSNALPVLVSKEGCVLTFDNQAGQITQFDMKSCTVPDIPPPPVQTDYIQTRCGIAKVMSKWIRERYNDHLQWLKDGIETGLIITDGIFEFVSVFPIVGEAFDSLYEWMENVLFEIADDMILANDLIWQEDTLQYEMFKLLMESDSDVLTVDLWNQFINIIALQPPVPAPTTIVTPLGQDQARWMRSLNLGDVMRRAYIGQVSESPDCSVLYPELVAEQWSYTFDFTTSDYGFTVLHGSYSQGVGFVPQPHGYTEIYLPFDNLGGFINSASYQTYRENPVSSVYAVSHIHTHNVTINYYTTVLRYTSHNGGLQTVESGEINVSIDRLALMIWDNTSGIIKNLTLTGTGLRPFNF